MAALVRGVTKVVEWVGTNKVKVAVERAGHITEELIKYQLYTIKEGDSLEAITLTHKCCTWDLIQLNEQNYPQLKNNPHYLKACTWPFPGSATCSGSDTQEACTC